MKKILVIVGTRPNFMKVSRFKEVAAKYAGLQVELVHTGQHSDDRMSTVFFEQLGLFPDHSLDIPKGTSNERIAQMMLALGPLIGEREPDLVMVVGDVDSTLAGAISAKKCGVPLVHLESGLRSGDMSMPEEMNRVIVDRIADHHLITEASGRANLLKEGVGDGSIHFVGNTMIDTLVRFDQEIQASPILQHLELGEGGHVLVTMHRPATVDDPERLRRLVEIILWLARDHRVIYPIHPRTLTNLERFGSLPSFQHERNVLITDPLDYFAFQKLLATSSFVLTDSGGVQEETTFRGIPCLTLRPNTERPVTITQGTNQLVTFDQSSLEKAVAMIRSGEVRGTIPELWDGHATERVFEVLQAIR